MTGLDDDPLRVQAVDFRGVRVLRTSSELAVPGFRWRVVAEIVVAEIDADEAFAPIAALRARVAVIGGMLTLLLLVVARLMSVSATRPLVALVEGAERLGGRDFGTRVLVRGDDELGKLALAFNRMAEALEKTTVSRADLEDLAGRLIAAQEEERKRIARDLHDDFSQRLAALAIEAGALARRLKERGEEADRAVKLERLRRGIALLGDDIHGVARRLHAATIEDLGLVAAVQAECRAFFKRGGPPVELEIAGEFEALAADVSLALFRIVQEALRNMEKHAAAQQVVVRCTRTPAGASLLVRDDGVGFEPRSMGRAGLGLSSMTERVRLLGGQIQVESAPGQGTSISVTLPRRSA